MICKQYKTKKQPEITVAQRTRHVVTPVTVSIATRRLFTSFSGKKAAAPPVAARTKSAPSPAASQSQIPEETQHNGGGVSPGGVSPGGASPDGGVSGGGVAPGMSTSLTGSLDSGGGSSTGSNSRSGSLPRSGYHTGSLNRYASAWVLT